MHGLTPEELEAIGGAEVVVPYAIPWKETGLLLVMAVIMAILVFGGVFVLFKQGGPVPWASNPDTGQAIHHQSIFAGYGLVLLLCLWYLATYLGRAVLRSPGLAAGSRGVRIHGAWPQARVLRWEEVRAIPTGPGPQLQVVLTEEPFRWRLVQFVVGLAGNPLRLTVARKVDLEALEQELWTLRGHEPTG